MADEVDFSRRTSQANGQKEAGTEQQEAESKVTMPTFFSLKELKTQAFAINTQKHIEDGVEWRRLNTVNLQWAETVISKGLEKPDADNEKLGLAILFYHRLRAMLLPKEFPREDLHEDHFGPHEGDF